jgi:putative membrane protein
MSGSSAGATTSGAPTAGTAGPAARQGGASAPRGAAAGGDLAITDRNFVTTAAMGGMFEAEAAKLAAQQATDPAVKAYASMVLDQHTKTNEELKQLAGARNVPLPAELPADKKAELKKLEQASGAAFDRTFVQEVGIKDHQDDIRSFEKASKDAKDPELRAWAAKTLPALRDHLAKAQTLPGGGSREKTTSLAPSDGGNSAGAGVAPASGNDAAPSGGNAAAPSGTGTTPPAGTTPPPPSLGR